MRIGLLQELHSVYLSVQNRNLARRFILLLDELYNARTRFFCTAASSPNELFAGTADDQAVFDMDQLEQLQFESAAEGQSPACFMNVLITSNGCS